MVTRGPLCSSGVWRRSQGRRVIGKTWALWDHHRRGAEESVWPRGWLREEPTVTGSVGPNGQEMGHYGSKTVKIHRQRCTDVTNLGIELIDMARPSAAIRHVVTRALGRISTRTVGGPETPRGERRFPLERKGGSYLLHPDLLADAAGFSWQGCAPQVTRKESLSAWTWNGRVREGARAKRHWSRRGVAIHANDTSSPPSLTGVGPGSALWDGAARRGTAGGRAGRRAKGSRRHLRIGMDSRRVTEGSE